MLLQLPFYANQPFYFMQEFYLLYRRYEIFLFMRPICYVKGYKFKGSMLYNKPKHIDLKDSKQ